MKWMILPYRRYFDFSGRSRRLEYWMFTLFIWIVIGALLVIGLSLGRSDPVAGTGDDISGAGMAVFAVLALFVAATIIPRWAVEVRRFHDQDKSGWMVLLGLIPYVGPLIVLFFMLMEGTAGENYYGPDPKGPEFDVDAFA